MKKTWAKPKLVVLSRGTPAENVLGNCKVEGQGGPSGETYYLTCNRARDPLSLQCTMDHCEIWMIS